MQSSAASHAVSLYQDSQASDASSAILKDIQDAFGGNQEKFKTKAELILHKRQRELKEEQERKRAERLQQQSIHKRELQPIMEEGALAVQPPDDPKKLKNEELKRKALLIARKEEQRRGIGGSVKHSSNGLSHLDSETLSNAPSDLRSELSESQQSSTSSNVMPFITGTKLPRAAVSASHSSDLVPLTSENLKALDSEIRKRPRQF